MTLIFMGVFFFFFSFTYNCMQCKMLIDILVEKKCAVYVCWFCFSLGHPSSSTFSVHYHALIFFTPLDLNLFYHWRWVIRLVGLQQSHTHKKYQLDKKFSLRQDKIRWFNAFNLCHIFKTSQITPSVKMLFSSALMAACACRLPYSPMCFL